MARLAIILSKYLFIFYIVFFLWHGFVAATNKNNKHKYFTALSRQRLILFSILAIYTITKGMWQMDRSPHAPENYIWHMVLVIQSLTVEDPKGKIGNSGYDCPHRCRYRLFARRILLG